MHDQTYFKLIIDKIRLHRCEEFELGDVRTVYTAGEFSFAETKTVTEVKICKFANAEQIFTSLNGNRSFLEVVYRQEHTKVPFNCMHFCFMY